MSIPWPWNEERVGPEFFARPAFIVAPALLGLRLLVQRNGHWVGGTICETEAYRQDDPASHSFRGESPRNRSMFADPGTVYVYQSYGVHWCLNISTGKRGEGEAVLIRAIAAEIAVEHMLPGASADIRRYGSGPGRLCAALGIDRSFDALPWDTDRLAFLRPEGQAEPFRIVRGPRIGISKAMDLMWRFGIQAHPSLSRAFPKQAPVSQGPFLELAP